MGNKQGVEIIEKSILGIDVCNNSIDELLFHISEIISNDKKKIIFGIGSMTFASFKFRRDLYDLYKAMDIIIVEGAGLPALALLFGVRIKGKIGLVNLSWNLFEIANTHRLTTMFFGSDSVTNKKAVKEISREYPNIVFAPSVSGYFEESETDGIVEYINRYRPHLLFIGATYPIKERFAVKYKDELIIHWFAQNLDFLSDENFSALPIGLENKRYLNNGLLSHFIDYQQNEKTRFILCDSGLYG